MSVWGSDYFCCLAVSAGYCTVLFLCCMYCAQWKNTVHTVQILRPPKALFKFRCIKLNPVHNLSVTRLQAQKALRGVFCKIQSVIANWCYVLSNGSIRVWILLFKFFFKFHSLTWKGQAIYNYVCMICSDNKLMQVQRYIIGLHIAIINMPNKIQ